mgnify:FL=1
MNLTAILKRPIVTEKSMRNSQMRRYTLAVARGASKQQIKQAVEKTFKVTVTKVNTLTVAGKTKLKGKRKLKTRSAAWKKAIIELKAGQTLDLFQVPAETKTKEQK